MAGLLRTSLLTRPGAASAAQGSRSDSRQPWRGAQAGWRDSRLQGRLYVSLGPDEECQPVSSWRMTPEKPIATGG